MGLPQPKVADELRAYDMPQDELLREIALLGVKLDTAGSLDCPGTACTFKTCDKLRHELLMDELTTRLSK